MTRLEFWAMSMVLPLSVVKSRLSELADEVARTHTRINVTRNGREYVTLVAPADLDSLEATIELLADRAAMERVATARRDVAAGDFFTVGEMAQTMEERRRAGR